MFCGDSPTSFSGVQRATDLSIGVPYPPKTEAPNPSVAMPALIHAEQPANCSIRQANIYRTPMVKGFYQLAYYSKLTILGHRWRRGHV